MGGEVQLNGTTTNQQILPDVTELANGDLMVTYEDWATGIPQVIQRRFVAPAGSGAYAINGSSSDSILVGGTGADTITSASANDILVGGAGNDRLIGALGDDLYRFGTGDGQDRIDNQDSAGNDVVEFGSGIARQISGSRNPTTI